MNMVRGLVALGFLALVPRLPAAPAAAKACCCQMSGSCAPGSACCARKAAPGGERGAPAAPAKPELSCCQAMPCTAPEPGPVVAVTRTGWHEVVRGPLADPSLAADPFKVPIA